MSKRRIGQFNFFNCLLNVKNLVLSNGSKQERIVIQWHKNSYFFKYLQKIALRLGASLPDPDSLRRLGAPPLRPPSVTQLVYSTCFLI